MPAASQGDINDLRRQDILFSGSSSGFCALNPDGSSIGILTQGTFVPGKSIADVTRSSYKYSTSSPSQIGLVILKP